MLTSSMCLSRDGVGSRGLKVVVSTCSNLVDEEAVFWSSLDVSGGTGEPVGVGKDSLGSTRSTSSTSPSSFVCHDS